MRAIEHFGELMPQQIKKFTLPDYPLVGFNSSNDLPHKDGKLQVRGENYHTDHSNELSPPRATALHAIQIPATGGDTQFVDVRAAYDDLPDDVKRDIDGLFSNSINTLKRNLNFFDQQARQGILAELAKGGTAGSSIDDISRRIQDLLIRKGITGIETDTRTYKLQASAERLARQALITGRQRAVVLEAIRNGHDLIRISKHGDESKMCKPHSGKIYSITGLTEGYELLDSVLWNGTFAEGSGVGHPYCRHSFTIHIPTNIEFVIFSREGEATGINNQSKTQREDFLERRQLKWERMSQADKNKWVKNNT
jgi:hypothetical protein